MPMKEREPGAKAAARASRKAGRDEFSAYVLETDAKHPRYSAHSPNVAP